MSETTSSMWLRWWYLMAGELLTYLLVSIVIVASALFYLLPAPILHRLVTEIREYIFGSEEITPERTATKPTTSRCRCSHTAPPLNNTSRTSKVTTTAAPSSPISSTNTKTHRSKRLSHAPQTIHCSGHLAKAETTPNSPTNDNPTTHLASKSAPSLKTINVKPSDWNNNEICISNRKDSPMAAEYPAMTADARVKMLSIPVAPDLPSLEAPLSAMVKSAADEASRHRPRCSDCVDGGLPYSAVTFRWANGGEHVYLVGSFTNWDTRTQMHRVRSTNDASIAWHTVTLLLPHGHHEYKFVVDGEYRVDPTKQTVASRLGDRNNLIHVYDD